MEMINTVLKTGWDVSMYDGTNPIKSYSNMQEKNGYNDKNIDIWWATKNPNPHILEPLEVKLVKISDYSNNEGKPGDQQKFRDYDTPINLLTTPSESNTVKGDSTSVSNNYDQPIGRNAVVLKVQGLGPMKLASMIHAEIYFGTTNYYFGMSKKGKSLVLYYPLISGDKSTFNFNENKDMITSGIRERSDNDGVAYTEYYFLGYYNDKVFNHYLLMKIFSWFEKEYNYHGVVGLSSGKSANCITFAIWASLLILKTDSILTQEIDPDIHDDPNGNGDSLSRISISTNHSFWYRFNEYKGWFGEGITALSAARGGRYFPVGYRDGEKMFREVLGSEVHSQTQSKNPIQKRLLGIFGAGEGYKTLTEKEIKEIRRKFFEKMNDFLVI